MNTLAMIKFRNINCTNVMMNILNGSKDVINVISSFHLWNQIVMSVQLIFQNENIDCTYQQIIVLFKRILCEHCMRG